MMRKSIFMVLICLVLFCASGCRKDKDPEVCFGQRCVSVEIAQTSEELSQGLQYRDSLERNHGMLFIFPQLVQAKFWMKNTLIPLDMIWLDENRRVIYIKKNAAPCLNKECPSYGPDNFVRYVLEVNAGYTDAYDINVYDDANIMVTD